jgi:hypothetical protein
VYEKDSVQLYLPLVNDLSRAACDGLTADPPEIDPASMRDQVPRFLGGLSGVIVQHVACGDSFIACLTDKAMLMTCGHGADGCLGHGDYEDVAHARIVEALLSTEVTHIACGTAHMVAVTADHEVYAWGQGGQGRLGSGLDDSSPLPLAVHPPQGVTVGHLCERVRIEGGGWASSCLCLAYWSVAVVLADNHLPISCSPDCTSALRCR